MDLERWLAQQRELVARWQLLDEGHTARVVDRALGRLRKVHSGVHTSARGRLTADQTLMAAALTAPRTGVGFSSAAQLFGCWDDRKPVTFTTVVRAGRGPHERFGDVLIIRTAQLELSERRGIPVVPMERTVLDLAPHLDSAALRRMFFEGLRHRVLTAKRMRDALECRAGVRGCRAVRELFEVATHPGFRRTRSPAESEALWQLVLAGNPPDRVNVWIAGFEADFVYDATMTIIELDGPGTHLDAAADAKRTAAWEAAGWTVLRIPTPAIF